MGATARMVWLPLLLLAQPQLLCAFSIDDSIHYAVSFRSAKTGETLGQEESKDEVVVFEPQGSKYTCSVPDISQQVDRSLDGYTGGTPWELIGRLKKDGVCSRKMDPYWSYEVCHGKYVMQFHEDKYKRSEYFLGNFHQNYISLKFDPTATEKVRYRDEDLAVLPVLYSQGTVCDITGKPRTTRVLYACLEGTAAMLEWVRETSSCNYDVLILTHLLCSHPSFTARNRLPHPIVCTLHGPARENPRPPTLIDMEVYHKEHFKQQYAAIADGSDADLSSSSSSSPAASSSESESEMLNSLYAEMETKKLESAGIGRGAKQVQPQMPQATDPAEAGDIHLAITFSTDRILSGEECIVGGAGWWKHELCFGIQVTQFHEEGNDRIDVLLGTFDRDIHRAWILQNPHKKPHRYGDEVHQVTHLYSKGDLCAETGAHRSVEVRIRCQRHANRMAVSISLSEPSICAYILTVEGERFCGPLQAVDKYGLLPPPAAKGDPEDDNPLLKVF